MSVDTILLYTIFAGILSIVYGFVTGSSILNASAGNAKMQEIASAIQIGAKAYLNRQYKTIAIVGVVVLVIISFAFSLLVGIGYLIDINKIPISKNLKKLLQQKKLKRLDYLFNGDDYQILFTASKSKRKYIKTLSSKMNQKISIIGQINTKSKNYLLDNRRIPIKYLKYQGYSHIF